MLVRLATSHRSDCIAHHYVDLRVLHRAQLPHLLVLSGPPKTEMALTLRSPCSITSCAHDLSLAPEDLTDVSLVLEISKERICRHRGGVGLSQAKTMRILIVEDEEHLARLVAEILGREGHTVETVGDGRTALA